MGQAPSSADTSPGAALAAIGRLIEDKSAARGLAARRIDKDRIRALGADDSTDSVAPARPAGLDHRCGRGPSATRHSKRRRSADYAGGPSGAITKIVAPIA